MNVYIYESEINAIVNQTLKKEFKNTETGGDLFGYRNVYGEPIIVLAGGSGPNAKCYSAEFEQDYKYVIKCETQLYEQHGLLYLGDWHSHHHLGLTQPSRGDIHRIHGLFEKNPRDFMVEIIVNHTSNSEMLSAFYYDRQRSNPQKINFKLLKCPESPIRKSLDQVFGLSRILNMLPLNSSDNKGYLHDRESNMTGNRILVNTRKYDYTDSSSEQSKQKNPFAKYFKDLLEPHSN